LPIGFTALWTCGFKARATLVAKDRFRRILGPALLTNHKRESIPTRLSSTQFQQGSLLGAPKAVGKQVYITGRH